MKFNLLIALTAACFSLISCSQQEEGRGDALGGRQFGGTLNITETNPYITLHPHRIADQVSFNVANQLYEGLVRFDQRNITKVLPALAESWEISPNGREYTFHLKKGVRFNDDPCFDGGEGREVNAADFLYSFEQLCTPQEYNTIFQYTFKDRVLGAEEYFNSFKEGKSNSSKLKGVEVIDDHTLKITLISPANNFLYMLAGTCGYVIPKEGQQKYGEELKVGTGPFHFSNEEKGESVLLERNKHYHRTDSFGNQLPFLDSILIGVVPDKDRELEKFNDGNSDIIFSLPVHRIAEMVERQIADFSSNTPRFILHRNAEFTTQYYQFNTRIPPFDNLLVRKAFSYAVNRDKIVNDVLHAEAFGPGICGVTPPGIPGYDITKIRGYVFNPAKARELLAKAGYPDGNGFPHFTVEVNSGGGKHVRVIEEVKQQIKKVLNVDLDFVVVPFSQKLDDAKYGRVEMFRGGWTADYASPENFLRLFYGVDVPDDLSEPSHPNTTRFKNTTFDSLLQEGFTTLNKDSAFAKYQMAEQILMDEAPILVLWYAESLKLMQSYVKGFYFNSMNYKDYSEVYIKRPAQSSTP